MHKQRISLDLTLMHRCSTCCFSCSCSSMFNMLPFYFDVSMQNHILHWQCCSWCQHQARSIRLSNSFNTLLVITGSEIACQCSRSWEMRSIVSRGVNFGIRQLPTCLVATYCVLCTIGFIVHGTYYSTYHSTPFVYYMCTMYHRVCSIQTYYSTYYFDVL